MVFCDLFASRRGVRQALAVLAGATTVVVLWGLADYIYGAPIVASAIAEGHPGRWRQFYGTSRMASTCWP